MTMESERYARNIMIEGFGTRGQRRLAAGRVLVVGAGGLGSPVLYYLAAAGVGTLGVIDSDDVELSNLQRQLLHRTEDIGRPKAVSAREKLEALNPGVKIVVYRERFTAENAAELVDAYDFVVDCCDNYATKYLINDVCVERRKPYCHGAVEELRGEVMTFVPGTGGANGYGDAEGMGNAGNAGDTGDTADLRSVFGDQPEARPVKGVLGAIAGIVGSIQATEAVKYLTGTGELITNRILIIDGGRMSFRSLKVR